MDGQNYNKIQTSVKKVNFFSLNATIYYTSMFFGVVTFIFLNYRYLIKHL